MESVFGWPDLEGDRQGDESVVCGGDLHQQSVQFLDGGGQRERVGGEGHGALVSVVCRCQDVWPGQHQELSQTIEPYSNKTENGLKSDFKKFNQI